MSDDDHPILTLVGLVAVAAGVLMVLQPSLAAAIGTGYSAVTVVGLLALAQGLRIAQARRASEVEGAETPDVETVESVPTPGEEFDRKLAGLGSGPHRTVIRQRSNLHETLEAAAVTAVADRENCSREQASERVEAGTWTDDVHAADFLGGTDAPKPPLLDRVKVAASAESSYQFRVRRTADAIARVAGVTDDGDEEASSSADGTTNTTEVATDDPRTDATTNDVESDAATNGPGTDATTNDPGTDATTNDTKSDETTNTGTSDSKEAEA